MTIFAKNRPNMLKIHSLEKTALKIGHNREYVPRSKLYICPKAQFKLGQRNMDFEKIIQNTS